MTNQNITESAIFLESDEPGQGTLFAQTATLSEAFFQQLKRKRPPRAADAFLDRSAQAARR
jgi:hypothetical protein